MMIQKIETNTAVCDNSGLDMYSDTVGTKRGNQFRCDVCGKFIGYDEFGRNEIETDYRPETLYECERITHIHKRCM